MPSILLFNDYPGYQKVALAAQAPILEAAGFEVFRLPTALFSNTLNYGSVARLDTTDFLKESLAVFAELGFCFDAVCTGFTQNREQTEFLINVCREQRRKGAALFCDPVLGDHGKLYHTVTREQLEAMKGLVAVSDYTTPNYTESCLLTGIPYREEGVSRQEAEELLCALRQMGSRNPVITSVPMGGEERGSELLSEDGRRYAVAALAGDSGKILIQEFRRIPIPYFGTGDCFTAFLTEAVMRGRSLEEAVQYAMKGVEARLSGQGRLV